MCAWAKLSSRCWECSDKGNNCIQAGEMGNMQIDIKYQFCWREAEPNRKLDTRGQMKGNLTGVRCAEATVTVVFERRQEVG